MSKIGREKVAEEMVAVAGTTREQADQVLKLAEMAGTEAAPATNDEILRALDPLVAGSEAGQAGVARLAELLRTVKAAGVSDRRLQEAMPCQFFSVQCTNRCTKPRRPRLSAG